MLHNIPMGQRHTVECEHCCEPCSPLGIALALCGACEREEAAAIAEEARERYVQRARDEDPHAPHEGTIADAMWLSAALADYDRQEEMR